MTVASSAVTMPRGLARRPRSTAVVVERLDERHVEHAHADALGAQPLGGLERAGDHRADGDHRDVVAVGELRRCGRARTARPSGVTAGTLKRGDAQVDRAAVSSAAQRTAARVWAGSAGTTTGRSAIARSPGQVLDRVVGRARARRRPCRGSGRTGRRATLL